MFRLIGRHFREAFRGIGRHFAMCLSSASAVTFSLILVSMLTLIIGNVNQITRNLQSNVQVFCKIDEAVAEEDIPALQRQVEQVSGVSSVEYSDKDSELDRVEAMFGEEGKRYEVYRNDNPLSRAFIVEIKEGYSISEVSDRIANISGLNGVEFGGATTEQFMDVLSNIRNGGYIIVLALTLLAIFLISNTIKLTIYNRNKEIGIMRQVGASNSYIRQPFVIEGVFIGLMGALIPVLLTIFGYQYLYNQLGGQMVSGLLTLLPVQPFAYQVAGFLVLIGIVVGLIGSLMSVNRYLRWRR
jgi:cell division transport system permease protein